MKMPAAISAWTREDEMRKTMRNGTATMRVIVRPIGRFIARTRVPRAACAGAIIADRATISSTSAASTGTSGRRVERRQAATSAARALRARACRAQRSPRASRVEVARA